MRSLGGGTSLVDIQSRYSLMALLLQKTRRFLCCLCLLLHLARAASDRFDDAAAHRTQSSKCIQHSPKRPKCEQTLRILSCRKKRDSLFGKS